MSRIDKLKEEIGWLKIVYGILIATEISLIAWLVQNYEKVSQPLFIVSAILIFLIVCVTIWMNKVAYRKIDKLEGL